MAEPFAGRVDGDRSTGRLVGRGACDMKGGVAAMVAAAEAVAARGTAGDVVLALVADEEHASIGTTAVIDRLGLTPSRCLPRRGAHVARPGRARTAGTPSSR